MIDVLINRIKDAYFDLERDGARRERFYGLTQEVSPGAVQISPMQMAMFQQMMQEQQQMAPQMQQPGMGAPMPNQGMPAPAPEPSMLDVIGSRR